MEDKKRGYRRLSYEDKEMIVRMKDDNPECTYQTLALAFNVCERTIQRIFTARKGRSLLKFTLIFLDFSSIIYYFYQHLKTVKSANDSKYLASALRPALRPVSMKLKMFVQFHLAHR